MATFKHKPIQVEAISFEELIEYGKQNSDTFFDGMPCSFIYNGRELTRCNHFSYHMRTNLGNYEITIKHMIVTNQDGDVYPMLKTAFFLHYDPVD